MNPIPIIIEKSLKVKEEASLVEGNIQALEILEWMSKVEPKLKENGNLYVSWEIPTMDFIKSGTVKSLRKLLQGEELIIKTLTTELKNGTKILTVEYDILPVINIRKELSINNSKYLVSLLKDAINKNKNDVRVVSGGGSERGLHVGITLTDDQFMDDEIDFDSFKDVDKRELDEAFPNWENFEFFIGDRSITLRAKVKNYQFPYTGQ